MRTPARRVYRRQPLIKDQMALTSFFEGCHEAQLKWERGQSKPATPDAALVLAVELNAFMEVDPNLKGASQATVKMVSATRLQQLLAKLSN